MGKNTDFWFIKSCKQAVWNSNFEHRPNFDKIAHVLSTFHKAYSINCLLRVILSMKNHIRIVELIFDKFVNQSTSTKLNKKGRNPNKIWHVDILLILIFSGIFQWRVINDKIINMNQWVYISFGCICHVIDQISIRHKTNREKKRQQCSRRTTLSQTRRLPKIYWTFFPCLPPSLSAEHVEND